MKKEGISKKWLVIIWILFVIYVLLAFLVTFVFDFKPSLSANIDAVDTNGNGFTLATSSKSVCRDSEGFRKCQGKQLSKWRDCYDGCGYLESSCYNACDDHYTENYNICKSGYCGALAGIITAENP